MAKAKTVWGIDIGQRALKALKLQGVGGQVQVEAFDVVEHAQILSEPDADRHGLVRSALEEFLSRNSVAGSTVCVSVPGQSSFTRFVKLPPVETKKIPDIVRFEAEQQIPFAISDVIWRWQTFHDTESPDVEVGIFAMKRTDIADVLDHFTAVEIDVDVVQMAPLSLYNFMMYDEQVSPDGATLLADVGADKTDLVVSDGARIWTRTIQIGGNNFTEALVKAFKLSFAKAEKLKRTAASSKYARQIFQSMRPVFADLVQEIQRSIGYYTSLHRDATFTRLVGLGNGFRLPGLQKFLEQNLNIPVVRIDSYRKLQPSAAVNTAALADNVPSFAVAYGLALQGLAEAEVKTNLLPANIARRRLWAQKRPWFAGVAAVILAIFAVHLYHNLRDKSHLGDDRTLKQASAIVKELKRDQSELGKWVNQGQQEEKQTEETFALYEHRGYWLSLLELVSRGIAAQATDQALLTEYAEAASEEDRQKVLGRIATIPRGTRRMFFIEEMQTAYLENVNEDDSAGGEAKRGFELTITGRTPLAKTVANPFLRAIFRSWQAISEDYDTVSVVDYTIEDFLESAAASGSSSRGPRMSGGKSGPGSMGGQPGRRTAGEGDEAVPKAAQPDPLFPDDAAEDLAKDTRFVIKLVVSIDSPARKDEATGS